MTYLLALLLTGFGGQLLTLNTTTVPHSLDDGVLVLQWQAQQVIVHSLAQDREKHRFVQSDWPAQIHIEHPEVQHLIVDYTQALSMNPMTYQAQSEQATLTIQGGDFKVLHHRPTGKDTGFIDLNADGTADIHYSGVSHVELAVDSAEEILLQTPPLCPEGMTLETHPENCDTVSFKFGLKRRLLSSALAQWPSTAIMRYKTLTVESDP